MVSEAKRDIWLNMLSGGVLAIAEGRSGLGTAVAFGFLFIALCCSEWGSFSDNLHRKNAEEMTLTPDVLHAQHKFLSTCSAANPQNFTGFLPCHDHDSDSSRYYAISNLFLELNAGRVILELIFPLKS